ncbi:hypothetical protein ACF1BQ_026565 [Bradyrhizobium sp. RDT10]
MNLVTNNKWIGQRTIRPDGMDKVTGRAQFAADTTMPGMIWGKVCAARIRTRASVRSTPRRRRSCRA